MSDTHEEMPWRRKHRVMPICTDEGNGLTHSEMASVVSSSAPSGKPSMGAEEPSMPAPSGEGMPEWSPESMEHLRQLSERDALRVTAGVIEEGRGGSLTQHHVEMLNDYADAIDHAFAEIARLTREKDEAVQTVTRVEVIDHRATGAGLTFSAWDCCISLSYQDDGRTLKVFVNDSTPPGATT